jgi:hypothetical protein
VDVSATVITIWQAEGVLMEMLHVDAAGAFMARVDRGPTREPLDHLAASVVERRAA